MENQILTVTEITRLIKNNLEDNFIQISVEGEISNLKYHTSGHLYFTLKDLKASISCVMWRSRVIQHSMKFNEGMKVIVSGNITVYEPRGSYQIDCCKISNKGIGELQLKFEELKNKLRDEGMFETERKKAIPEFPDRIGIITSPTGAVIQDISNILNRRMPSVEKILFPVKVQGDGSKEEIVNAIKYFNQNKLVDVIILARGGGTIEDLWTFNEEEVAREIFKSKIPIISAVGHEVDFTIADFVSDLRAPTPSAAAELVVKDRKDIIEFIRNLLYNSQSIVQNMIKTKFHDLKSIQKSYSFNLPISLVNQNFQKNDELISRLKQSITNNFKHHSNNLLHLKKSLQSLKVDNILKRGFSIVMKNESIVSDSSKLVLEDNLDITFYKGSALAKIKSIKLNEKNTKR